MTYSSKSIVQHNKDGVITQITTSSHAQAQSDAMKQKGVLHILVCDEDLIFDGKKVSVFDCCVVDGRLALKEEPSISDIEENQRLKNLDDADRLRVANQPKPIHSVKLAIALSGNFKMLENEARLKSVTPEALAQSIISKASEAMAKEDAYQAQIIELKKA